MDNNGTINLKNLRKPTVQPVAPVSVPAPVQIHTAAPTAVVTPPPQPVAENVATPPRPMATRMPSPAGWNLDWAVVGKYAAMALGGIVVLFGIGYYIYAHFWTRSPFGPTPGTPAEVQQEDSGTQQAAAAASSASSASGTLTVEDIVQRVGKLMVLPEGETPTLAGVSDPNALGGQEFFKNAKVGDVVLMYGASRRAILYDPTANKIIEVAPITTDATSPQS